MRTVQYRLEFAQRAAIAVMLVALAGAGIAYHFEIKIAQVKMAMDSGRHYSGVRSRLATVRALPKPPVADPYGVCSDGCCDRRLRLCQ